METEPGKSEIAGRKRLEAILSVVEVARVEEKPAGFPFRDIVNLHCLSEHPPGMEELRLERETFVAPEGPLRTKADVAVLIVGEALKGSTGDFLRGGERPACHGFG